MGGKHKIDRPPAGLLSPQSGHPQRSAVKRALLGQVKSLSFGLTAGCGQEKKAGL